MLNLPRWREKLPSRGSSGSWIRPYGSSPNGFLTMKRRNKTTLIPFSLLEDRQATQEEFGPVLPAGRDSTGRTCLTHRNPLGSCLSQPLYAILLPVLVAAIFRNGGSADDASSHNHVCAMRDLQEWRAKARTDACPMISCKQKRSGFVVPSCFSFFLSGLLFAFIMTFPLTLLCVRH
jgi:hypothetical protein